MRVTVELINAKRLQRKLSRVAKVKDRRAVVRKAARASMKPLHQATKSAAPVHTGLLKSLIKLRAGKKSRTRIGVSVIIRKLDWKKAAKKNLVKKSKRYRTKSWNAFYANFVEFGTKKIKANPFMKKIAKQQGRRVLKDFMRRITKEIEALARK